ncbi:MAG: 4Fe-4S dicluster domain-containing protein, partial [Deltaproteobacteria bacterium]|nr:4Fe-4S dicluster domain-containing protein [Deltaproteobacteria bacterium]
MKTFSHLIQEVQDKGLCHHCGGCVAFCTAINYGALELGEDGRPRYRDKEKCIECGICYSICPEIRELDEETKT